MIPSSRYSVKRRSDAPWVLPIRRGAARDICKSPESGVTVRPLSPSKDGEARIRTRFIPAPRLPADKQTKVRLHIRIIWAAAARWQHPIDVLRRVLDVACLAVVAAPRVDHKTRTALRLIGKALPSQFTAPQSRLEVRSEQLHISAKAGKCLRLTGRSPKRTPWPRGTGS